MTTEKGKSLAGSKLVKRRFMSELGNDKLPEQSRVLYGGIEVPPCPPANQPIYKPDLSSLPKTEHYHGPMAIERTFAERFTAASGEPTDLVIPPERIDSDYTILLHSLFKRYGHEATIDRIGAFVAEAKEDAAVARVDILGSFLNIKLDSSVVGTEIVKDIEALGEKYGEFDEGQGQRVVIDTSSPNIAKEMTVAHLRSTVIGEALGRLYQNAGYEVIRDNHLGDWGTQFGTLGRAFELWGAEVPDLQDGGDPIKGLLELYVRMNKAIEDEESTQEASDLRDQGLEWFRRLEEGDPEARKLWRWALDISLVEAQQVYERLGSNFEYILGESEYVGMLPSVISAMTGSGLANQDEKGRVVVDFGEESKLNPLPIQKSDGTSLYASRDLATLAARNAWFDPAKILYVVGGEQSAYFTQVFQAFKDYSARVGEQPAAMEHVSFGMVKLPEGKMSTRRGNVIFLQDVLNEAVARAKAVVETHNVENGSELTPAEVDEIAEKVGIGAVIYSELRQNRSRGIDFDWDEVLSFQGNSGPYLQYTNTRINAIFRKLHPEYKVDHESPLAITSDAEAKLAKELGGFPQAIKEAINKNEPSLVAKYLYQLASAYNSFYKQCPVLNSPDKETLDSRLRLSAATSTVLRRGMDLLAIPIPEKM